ncbi:MAG: hypothetical protein KIT84_11315 [Labilithrix sp.]|nr:hypothetical protein [Labilithrix sp.]MCW5811598.1 hypothetical protein [Labilithrix sp.]
MLAVSTACAPPPQEGRLYRHDVAAVSRFTIENTSAASANASAELADGTRCEGRVSRTDRADNARSVDSDSDATTDAGVAVLVCRSNAVLRCRLVHRIAETYAFGECADQYGVRYTVVF